MIKNTHAVNCCTCTFVQMCNYEVDREPGNRCVTVQSRPWRQLCYCIVEILEFDALL